MNDWLDDVADNLAARPEAKPAKPTRRPLGFVEQPPVPCVDDPIHAVSGTWLHATNGVGCWRGVGWYNERQEPWAQ